ncbi:MAG: hypothetical protein ABI360_10220, partial [Allobranchiibius sp.]
RSEGRDIPDHAAPVGIAPEPAPTDRDQSNSDSTPSGVPRGGGMAPVAPGPPESAGGLDTDAVRRAWPDVLDAIAKIKRVTWALLSQHAHVMDYTPPNLVLGVSSAGLAQTFERGSHRDVVRQAVLDTIGITVSVHARPDSGAPTGTPHPDDLAQPPAAEPGAEPGVSGSNTGIDTPHPASETAETSPAPERRAPGREAVRRPPRTATRRRPEPTIEPGGWGSNAVAPAPEWATPPATEQPPEIIDKAPVEEEGSRDDEDVEDAGEVGIPVVTSILGGVVIDDQRD